MLNVVVNQNVKYGLVTSSRDVAKGLGKQHKHVLDTLDGLSNKESQDFDSLVMPHEYSVKGQQRKYKEYLLTKDGFILYIFNIQGYLDFKFAYIQKFNEMEEQLKSPRIEEFVSLTGDYGDINKSIENMEKYLEQGKTWILTALQFVNNLDQLRREVLINLKMLKKDLKKEPKETPLTVKAYSKKLNGTGFKKVYSYLREHGYVEKEGTRPTEKAIKEGFFIVEEKEYAFSSGKKIGGFKSRITPKGQKYGVTLKKWTNFA